MEAVAWDYFSYTENFSSFSHVFDLIVKWTQMVNKDILMLTGETLPETGTVKPKGQQSFQVLPGNMMTLCHKGAELGLALCWQTWLTKMFPSGWLLCISLDAHSGQIRGSLGSMGKHYNWLTQRGQETLIWWLCSELSEIFFWCWMQQVVIVFHSLYLSITFTVSYLFWSKKCLYFSGKDIYEKKK